ncbi:hypothetical protein D9756_007274 [Leucocoprinus leucothites]|uniref:DDE-1 domain-containing protein n=1 Tax=Leucocoprinus leucothites TaxID=201217 RepID=A0A8H5FYQ7_9AGAR|nr:hypothetical protein D9756_007274 [Leucoagaricus leucothites]
MCYPPHTTHIYQGLDVVVFSPLKVEYGKYHDQLLRDKGSHISKENFLTVYSKAHLAALQPALIRKAFSATGLVPFNCNAISKDKFVPSCNTSFQHFTPIPPPTPIWIMTELIIDAVQPSMPIEGDTRPSEVQYSQSLPLQHALSNLATTNAHFLVSDSPIKASSPLPKTPPIQLLPIRKA